MNLKIAHGVVHFTVWPVSCDDGQPYLYIRGDSEWSRPVVGLIGTEPVVLDENTAHCTVSEYLDMVMPRELQSDHSAHTYMPRRDGPVGPAPGITVRPKSD